MNNKPILYSIIGLLVGIGVTTYVASIGVKTGNTGIMQMMGIQGENQMKRQYRANITEVMNMGSSMDDMMGSMTNKTGNDFDRAFLKSMIVHHQGAIDMAKAAQQQAQHAQIKTLAGEIIEAQTKEINLMQQWQEAWGY